MEDTESLLENMDYGPTSASPKTKHGAADELGTICYLTVKRQCNFWRHPLDYVESSSCLQDVPCMPTVLLTIWFLLKMLLGEDSCSGHQKPSKDIKMGKQVTIHSRPIGKFSELQNIY